ncbi:MAG: DUF1266 domain-containing protein [Crocinitomicaceae bacterium]|nr:DUF1266 domain-containing protein [Crocinitomicaceae bacterium]
MQELFSQPWFKYGVIGFFIAAFVVRYLFQGYREADNSPVKFNYAGNSSLSEQQKFGIALHGVLAAYNGMDLNILEWSKNGKISKRLHPYLQGWGIEKRESYLDLTNYYLSEGRRAYFDVIYPMYTSVPKEEWNIKMQENFGKNERAQRILTALDEHKIIDILKSHKIIEFDSDMEIGTMAWDICNLVGQARRAFTAELISEKEAWDVIGKATAMAKENFNSWEDFGRSLSIGFALDMYKHPMYGEDYFKDYLRYCKGTVSDAKSPWNTISW